MKMGKFWKVVGLTAVFLLSSQSAYAGDLDFIVTPICGFANVFRGPIALAVATIAFFAAGAAALWGEEIAGISKKVVNIIIAVTIMFGGAAIVSWVANKVGVTASCQTSSLSTNQTVA